MSESYTEGGDSFKDIWSGHWEGQTFRVLEEHVLAYVDIDIKGGTIITHPVLLLFYADASHEPFGDYLSRNRGYIVKDVHATGLRRVRFPMQAVTLSPLSYYVIVLMFYGGFLEAPIAWHFDAGDATYPRGMRIYTEDAGANWTACPNDDHIFVEFGSPPAPPPPPDPPIPNFSVLKLGWTNTPTMLKLVTWTSVPCHLFMVWTVVEPETHLDAMLRRGTVIGKALRKCFVDWNTNEQEEVGDTLYHTFLKPTWPVCETRYFTFRATVAGTWSPSVGPIFQYHREEVIVEGPYYQQINAHPWTQWLRRYVSGQTYVQCHGAADASSVLVSNIRFCKQDYTGVNKYTIDRKPVYFDTSVIPSDAVIYSAVLSQRISFLPARVKDIYLYDAPLLHDPPVVADYGYIRTLDSGEISKLLVADMMSAERCFWKINAAGLASINRTGKTKWALRTIDDVNAVAPTTSVEGVYIDNEPEHLVVAYYLPA